MARIDDQLRWNNEMYLADAAIDRIKALVMKYADNGQEIPIDLLHQLSALQECYTYAAVQLIALGE